jgi:hypothetical protein
MTAQWMLPQQNGTRAMFFYLISMNWPAKQRNAAIRYGTGASPAKGCGNDTQNLSQKFDRSIFLKNTMISHPGTGSRSPPISALEICLLYLGYKLDLINEHLMNCSFEYSDKSKKRLEAREEAMREAKAILTSLGVRFSQPDPHQLQFGEYSYWPGRKRLYRQNDESSSKLKAMEELTELIQSSELLRKR